MALKLVCVKQLLFVLAHLPLSWSQCRYRDSEGYPEDIFSNWACWGCYSRTQSEFFSQEPLENIYCNLYMSDQTFEVPGLRDRYNACVPFTYKNRFIVEEVANTFKYNASVARWRDCCKDAESCCSRVMMNDEIGGSPYRCASVWDGWTCFASIPSGATAEEICPKYAFNGLEAPRCHHISHKQCTSEGKWIVDTDYSGCDSTSRVLKRTKYQLGILAASSAFCLPGILLILSVPRLRHHRQFQIVCALMTAIAFDHMMTILTKSLVVMHKSVMKRNEWSCKMLSFFDEFSTNMIYTCQLLMGIYLYRSLLRTRVPTMRWYYVGGLVFSFVSATTWAALMAKLSNKDCWQTDDGLELTPLSWALNGPRLAMLTVNLIILVYITRVLWDFFKSKEDNLNPGCRAVKRALICTPVFGLRFLFELTGPDADNCSVEQFYFVLSYAVEGSQGIFVAILHCYREIEVKAIFVSFWSAIKSKFARRPKNASSEAVMESETASSYSDHSSTRPSARSPQSDTIVENYPKKVSFQSATLGESSGI